MCSVVHEYPPHVREGLEERMRQLLLVMEKEIGNIQDFGEAYDE